MKTQKKTAHPKEAKNTHAYEGVAVHRHAEGPMTSDIGRSETVVIRGESFSEALRGRLSS